MDRRWGRLMLKQPAAEKSGVLGTRPIFLRKESRASSIACQEGQGGKYRRKMKKGVRTRNVSKYEKRKRGKLLPRDFDRHSPTLKILKSSVQERTKWPNRSIVRSMPTPCGGGQPTSRKKGEKQETTPFVEVPENSRERGTLRFRDTCWA